MLQIAGSISLSNSLQAGVNPMKRFGNLFMAATAMIFVLIGAAEADAQRRNERQVRDLVRTLNAQIDDFQYGLDHHFRSSSVPRQDVESVHENIRNLQTAVDDFDESLANRRENRDDIRAIVNAAKEVDTFLAQNPQNRRIDTNWQGVRTTINSLAANYGVNPDWNTRGSNFPGTSRDRTGDDNYPGPVRDQTGRTTAPTTRPVFSQGLTGTYRLDTARSENTADIISSSGVGAGQRQDLESKLEAPEEIAIDVRGNEVTLASSKSSPVSFVADGSEKVESSNGR